MFVAEECSAKDFLEEALKYHKTSINGYRSRPEVFNGEIIYNLLALAIEKYFMAFLVTNQDMADNHTFTDLINSYERIKPFPQELTVRLQELEKLQNLCPAVKAFSVSDIEGEQIEEMIDVTNSVCVELGYESDAINNGVKMG